MILANKMKTAVYRPGNENIDGNEKIDCIIERPNFGAGFFEISALKIISTLRLALAASPSIWSHYAHPTLRANRAQPAFVMI